MADINRIMCVLDTLERKVSAMTPHPTAPAGAAGARVTMIVPLPAPAAGATGVPTAVPAQFQIQPLPAPVPSPTPAAASVTATLDDPVAPLGANYQRAVQRAELNTTMAPDDGQKVLCQAIHPGFLVASKPLLAHLITRPNQPVPAGVVRQFIPALEKASAYTGAVTSALLAANRVTGVSTHN
jgi:hypothetical protein